MTRLLSAACLTLLAAIVGSAQDPAQKDISTSTGVFTAAQATRGEQTYMSICVACHPAGTYTTAAFRERWNGAPVSDLFDLISTTMPKMEPGSLEADEYAQAVAYLLKINGAPAGKNELPSDIKALRRIRISMSDGK